MSRSEGTGVSRRRIVGVKGFRTVAIPTPRTVLLQKLGLKRLNGHHSMASVDSRHNRSHAESMRRLKLIVTHRFREKASVFLTELHPAQDAAERTAVLGALRKRDFDATHHCSAWREGVPVSASSADDDGEPAGTAGRPMLAMLEGLKSRISSPSASGGSAGRNSARAAWCEPTPRACRAPWPQRTPQESGKWSACFE